MQERHYTIVGLRHHAWQGEGLAQRLREAEGKRVVLMREEMNEWNHEATAAYIDTEMVGYVADGQCRESSAYCDMADAQLLEGRVTGADAEHHQLTVAVAVSGTLPDRQDETAVYEQWEHNYNTAPLMGYTTDEQRLLLLRRDLLHMLHKGEPLDATMQRNLEVYSQLMAWDISREATDDRRHIIGLMVGSSDARLSQWGHQLEVDVTTLGSPEARQLLADYIFRQLPLSDAFQQMVLRHSHTDAAVLESQLRSFPHRLFDEYRLSATDFVSKLYYRRVPARPLRYFLSGLLLLEHLRHGTPEADRLSRHEQQAVADALEYVGRISHCVVPDRQGDVERLWQRLTTDYAERIADVQRMRQSTFNRRFVCRLVGTLLQLGIYRQDVTQTEYTRLLEGSSRSNLRKEVNQGVDDDATRQYIRQLLRQLNG